MDYRDTYKGHGIRVYQDAAFVGSTPTHWLFDIYEQRDNGCVNDWGIADSELAALAAARKWIDDRAT